MINQASPQAKIGWESRSAIFPDVSLFATHVRSGMARADAAPALEPRKLLRVRCFDMDICLRCESIHYTVNIVKLVNQIWLRFVNVVGLQYAESQILLDLHVRSSFNVLP